MVTFSELRAADFSHLASAADAWARLPAGLTGAGGVGQDWDRVRKGLGDAGWDGAAARAAAPVMHTVSAQIHAAGDEAHDLARLLTDAHERLTTAQRSLNAVVEEIDAPGGALSADAAGGITLRSRDGTVAAPEDTAAAERRADGYRRRIQQLLQEAGDVDEALYRALYVDRNGTGNDEFADAGTPATIAAAERDVARARADAGAAVRLASLGRDLTGAQVGRLNALLAAHGDDPEFGAAFATALTAQGTLDLWAQVSDAFTRTHDVPGKDVDSLRLHLGLTLAAATRYRSPAMTDWEDQMVARSSTPIDAYGPGPGHPLGFQVMSSLMHRGTYDGAFLDRYGKALLAVDRQVTAADPAGWSRFGTVAALDPQGHADPVSGLMDALGHSPQEARTFMDQGDRFRYLTHERRWSDDASGKASLGHALMAATTGHACDVPADAGTPAHSAAQARLMKRVVEYYARDGACDAQGPMSQSLGRMAAEYLPDFDRTLAGYGGRTMADLLTDPGASMGLGDQVAATAFLHNVASHPSGYAAISLGQTRYSTHLIDYHLAHPEALEDLDAPTRIDEIARRGSAVQEILDRGRADAVVDGAVRSDASYNRALGYGSEWTKATLGTVSGFAADAVTDNPVAGPFVEKGVETGTGDVIDLLTAGLTRDTTDSANHDAVAIMRDSEQRYENAVRTAVDSSPTRIPRRKIDIALSDGFDDGFDDGARLYGDEVVKHGAG